MPKPLLVVACSICMLVLGLIGSPTAWATPTPALTLSTAVEPTESITTQLLAEGLTTSGETTLSATIKPTGGQGCGANFAADQTAGGSVIFNASHLPEGSFSSSINHTFQAAGSYLYCAWLEDNAQIGSPVVATASLTISVRPPHLALSVSVPASVTTGQTFQLITTAQAEAERPVSVFLLTDSGRGCPANAGAAVNDPSEIAITWPTHGSTWNVIGGPFSESVNETLKNAGHYLVCAYFQYPSSQSPPELTAAATIAVVSPPPPCVVPTLSSTVKLTTAERALLAAGCTVGKVAYAASRKIGAGYVLALSPLPSTQLPSGTAVNLTVSTGPPCVVPHLAAGSTLKSAERRIRRAHCVVGKVHSARSRHRARGLVLHLGVRAGRVLRSGAPVEIVISRGRR